MSKDTRKQFVNRGVMWGQYLAFLEMAKHGLQHAEGGRFLVAAEDQELLRNVNDQVIALAQRAWAAKEAETNAKSKRRRKTR